MDSGIEPSSYFGLFSAAQRARAIEPLASLGVRFEFVRVQESAERLSEWTALDESSASTLVGFELFIRSDDVAVLGNKLIELFPERTFGVG